MRSQLAKTYSAWFQSLNPGVISAADAGSPAKAAPDLLRRLVMPAIRLQDAEVPAERSPSNLATEGAFQQRPVSEPARESGMQLFAGGEAASMLLNRAEAVGSVWDDLPETIRFFGSSRRVREAAIARTAGRRAPFAHIAAVFEGDAQPRRLVRDAAPPCPPS